jgi:hypothetical protein
MAMRSKLIPQTNNKKTPPLEIRVACVISPYS